MYMSPNQIDRVAQKSCVNLEAKSGRHRRWSTDQARKAFYARSRAERYSRRLNGIPR